ncbi:MAG: hypothetical protein IJ920_07540 [Paludibacteraceae bacterium]|nr:hypothetical protein [Paludibacteraceae bacterium]MBR4564205.1 hypothetical protein [Paludibacteraceae bacterium]
MDRIIVNYQQPNQRLTAMLNNFEIVATALIALLFFREEVGRRLPPRRETRIMASERYKTKRKTFQT